MISKKWEIFCTCLIILITLPQTAFATESLEYRYAGSDSTITYLGESNTYYLDVTNNMDEKKTIIVLPNPTYHNWFITGGSKDIEIEPNTTERTEVTITPPSDTTTGMYQIVFQKCVKNEPICTKNIRIPIYVIDKNQLIFETMQTTKDTYFDNENIETFFRLNNTKYSMVQNYSYRIDILDSNDTIAKSITDKLPEIDRNDLYAKTLDTGKLTEGTYTLKMMLLDDNSEILQEKTAVFTVKEYIEIIIPKEPSINIKEKPGVFIKTTTITLRNKNDFDYTAEYTDIKTPLKRYLTTPATISDKEYRFECRLTPQETLGDTCAITYQINYWKAYIVIIAIIIILIEIYFNITKPTITKRDYRKNGYHNIHINIINKSPKTLYNVTVTDTISRAVKTTGHFSLRPKSEKVLNTGKEIKWNLAVLRPKEQRILSYTIKPRFKVKGGIKLPNATLTAEDKNKKKIKITSNSLIIKTGD